MTNETRKQRNGPHRGSVEATLNDTAPMMRKMPGCCGPMMAEMMQKRVSPEGGGEPGPAGETGQQSQDFTRRTAGCGCGPMMERVMGKCFEGGRDEEGRPQD